MEEPRKQPPPPSPAKAGFGGQNPPEDRDGGLPPNLPTSPPEPQPERSAVPTPPQQKPIHPQPPPYRPEQKQIYLNREEVRTMEKDVARVREGEAAKEKQRIAELKALRESEKEQAAVETIRASAFAVKRKEEAQRKTELRNIQDSILPPGEERRVRDLPSPPSKSKKVFVRLLVIIFVAFIAVNVALFAGWFFFARGGQTTSFQMPEISFSLPGIPFISRFFGPSPPPPPAPTPETPPPPPAGEPRPSFQGAIAPAREATIQFLQAEDLAASLSQLTQEQQPRGFTQLLFRQTAGNEYIGSAREFFDLFGIALPPDVATHFSGNTFFFLYTYERGSRFGIIMETASPEEAETALEQWEPQIEQDLAPVMPFWDQKTPAYTTAWRSSARHGVAIRFQTFSLQDYGIVHAKVGNFIIFASSFEATADAIEALQSAAPVSQEIIGPGTLAVLQGLAPLQPLSSLSLEQKLGQLFMIGFQDATLTPELEELMRRLQPGGVLLLARNIESIEQLRQLTRDLQRVSLEYSGLPLFIAVDQEGGAISRVGFGREQTAQSIIQDEERAFQVGNLRAEELTFLGVNLNLSPVLDSTEQKDFLFSRTFQAGRLETGQLAKALLEGQKRGGILSTAKHFPGYGNIPFNPEQRLAVVREFPDISPFVFALSAKPEFLMLSNVVYTNFDPDQPFSFSPKGIAHVRSELNFQGIILTDDLAQPSLLNNYSVERIASAPLEAGVNMLMVSEESYATEAHEALLALLWRNPLLKKNIEDSAAEIFNRKKEFFFSKNGELEPIAPIDHLSWK